MIPPRTGLGPAADRPSDRPADRPRTDLRIDPRTERERDHAEHVEIYEAVRSGDAAAAERLTREHLTAIRDAVTAADFPEEDAR